MLNGNGKLSIVLTTNVCRRDGNVLLRTNTLEDELHTGVSLLLKTKLTSILPPYILRVWGSSLKFAFLLPMSSKNALSQSTIACTRLCSRENFRETFGLPEPFGLPNMFAGVPGPPSRSPKLINQ